MRAADRWSSKSVRSNHRKAPGATLTAPEKLRMAHELAGGIRREFGLEVELRDERLSSLEAERILREKGRIRNAGDIDRLAAVLLLQSYLDEINK